MFLHNNNPRFDRATVQRFVHKGMELASVSLVGENGVAGILHFENTGQAETVAAIISGNVEELAERIADVIRNTHDLDVTDDNYGVAVACDLLGIDTADVYAARRAEKARKEAAA